MTRMKHGTMSMYVGGPCRCNSCRKAARDRMRLYRAANLDKVQAYEAEYRKRNSDAIKAREAVYRLDRQEERRLYGVEYKRRNKEALLAKQRTAEAKAKRRGISASRRARQRDQFVEDVDCRIVYQMHGGRCGICKEFVAEDAFDVDHVIPIVRGGLHAYINCQPTHPTCNKRKGGRLS